MSEEAILEQGTETELEQEADVSTDASTVEQESAATENTEKENNQASEGKKGEILEGKTIPYKRFTEINNRMKNAEAKAKMFEGKEYLLNLEQIIASDPEKEAAVIAALNGKTTKKEKDPAESLIDEKIERYANKVTTKVIKENLAAYNEDFDQLIGEVDSSEKELMTALVDIKLNSKYKGWKNVFRPGLVEKALNEVKGDLNKIFNSQKKEYINGKISDTNPDIGKGVKGTKVERIPIEDETAFQAAIAKAMNGG